MIHPMPPVGLLPASKLNTKALIALLCGVLSAGVGLFSGNTTSRFTIPLAAAGLVLGIAAIVLASLARKDAPGQPWAALATVGLALGVIGIVWNGVVTLVCGVYSVF